MKISINKDLFLEKLTLASQFTSSKLSSISSLQGVLLKGEKKDIHFYATNLSSYYHTVLKTEKENEFEVIVDPKRLVEFLSLVPSGKIDIEIKEKQVVVSFDKTRGEFPLFAKEDFPQPPKIEKKFQKIPTKFLQENLPLILFSASHDETRPVLTGVNFLAQEEEIMMVTTDGFRLSLLRLKKEINIPSMIVPSSFLEEVGRLTKEEEEILLNYSPSEKVISFHLRSHDLYSRLIEGEYPAFEKVIPTEKKTTITTEKESFLRNIKLASIFARDASNIIVIQTADDGLMIKPKTDKGVESVAYQEAAVQGEEQRIAFNYKFLLDFLTHLEAKKVTIEFLRADSPAVFKSDKHPNFLHIIMPVRIQE